MEYTGERACRGCEATTETKYLERCTICHKDFCADCGVRGHGNKQFCSQGCADVFFFGTDDPDDPRYDDDETDWDD